MQANIFQFVSSVLSQAASHEELIEGINHQELLSFFSLPLSRGGGMDLSKAGERIMGSLLSARSLGFLLPNSEKPEVPARAAAAAAAARVFSGLPLYQRPSLQASSEALISIHGSKPLKVVEDLEDEFYEEEFDPVRHVLEHISSEENEMAYFERQATLRFAQLDRIQEHLTKHVMEHHAEMVKGMHLVKELEIDLKVTNVICMNGRRHLLSSMHEVSRDLIVTSNSRRKQILVEMLSFLKELCRVSGMQVALEDYVEKGKYLKAFQVLSEYLQLLDGLSGLSVTQEMNRGIERWLVRTLQKLDAVLLGVCQEFKQSEYLTVLDAYALIGDVSGIGERIQCFFMQEVLSETHSLLKDAVLEDQELGMQSTSDLCLQIPESKLRKCLLKTLAAMFRLMTSYYAIMDFHVEGEGPMHQMFDTQNCENGLSTCPAVSPPIGCTQFDGDILVQSIGKRSSTIPSDDSVNRDFSHQDESVCLTMDDSFDVLMETGDNEDGVSDNSFPWHDLRRDAGGYVAQILQRGCRNFWHLTSSRVSVLLSSPVVCSTSIHQFLKNYEDLDFFALAGEAFSGYEAKEFRKRLKVVCEEYFLSLHRQNMCALRMVLEKETWVPISSDSIVAMNLAGLAGDGALLVVSYNGTSTNAYLSTDTGAMDSRKNGFVHFIKKGNPFLLKSACISEGLNNLGTEYSAGLDGKCCHSSPSENVEHASISVREDENEDLLADFIDEDSQLPTRMHNLDLLRSNSHLDDDDVTPLTGSCLCVLRLMEKYGRLMRKLEIINIEFFKGICQLFGIFFYYLFEKFGGSRIHVTGKGLRKTINSQLDASLSRITQDCDQWLGISWRSSASIDTSLPSSFTHMETTSISTAHHSLGSLFSIKERCVAVDSLCFISRILQKSKSHLVQKCGSLVEEFYGYSVDAVPDLVKHIHLTTTKLFLYVHGYVDQVSNSRWETKELGLEHNGYVDLLLGEFKHYRTRLADGEISKTMQETLLECGLEVIADVLVEGFSRVRRCTDEGRALMSLDLQVLINGLQHLVSVNVKPKLQVAETFIKAYYLPETEYVHWVSFHPEFTKSQIIGLINLVATMKGWKRRTRLDILEKIESGIQRGG